MAQNKYITLSAIPSHDQRDCDEDTTRCHCHDEAKIVYSMKDCRGHCVYAQTVIRPPEWGRGYKGKVDGMWKSSGAFAQWLQFKMEEFASELENEYRTPTRGNVYEYADAETGRERADTVIQNDFMW
jgi:hypothetical protein